MARFVVPPGWPEPPPGWYPSPQWRPDPQWPSAPDGWQFWRPDAPRRPALDRAVEQVRSQQGERAFWGWGIAIWPLVGFAVVILSSIGIALSWQPSGAGRVVANGALQGLEIVVVVGTVVLVGRGVAERCGGWGPAFGWSRPAGRDVWIALVGLIANYAARVIVLAFVVLGIHGLRGKQQLNVDLHGASPALIVVLLISAVVLAPPLEELVFRGMLLRTLMLRWGFWPAAVTSSLVFAGAHAWQVHTAAAALLLVIGLFVFALGQCLVVRFTGTLSAAIGIHALSNLVTTVLALTVIRG